MCVIIKRDPKVIIPDDKILSAAKVNPDGFGISVIDRGRIVTDKVHRSGGTDPQDILKRLADAIDQPLFLHLRYTTAGKTNEANCHPFQVFDGDSYQVQFMHNGTLSKFNKGRDHDYSDTWHFNEEILKPLIRAFYETEGVDVLANETVKKIVSEFQGASVLTLYDSAGNVLNLENSSCKQFDGWWASNTYSFNDNHRTPTTTAATNAYSPTNRSYYYGQYGDFDDGWPPAKPKSATPAPTAAKTASTTTTKKECKELGYALMQAKRLNVTPQPLSPPQDRLTFTELAEIADIKDIFYMSEGDIYDLVCDQPLAATALLMDLIYDMWAEDQKARKKVLPLGGASLNAMAS